MLANFVLKLQKKCIYIKNVLCKHAETVQEEMRGRPSPDILEAD